MKGARSYSGSSPSGRFQEALDAAVAALWADHEEDGPRDASASWVLADISGVAGSASERGPVSVRLLVERSPDGERASGGAAPMTEIALGQGRGRAIFPRKEAAVRRYEAAADMRGQGGLQHALDRASSEMWCEPTRGASGAASGWVLDRVSGWIGGIAARNVVEVAISALPIPASSDASPKGDPSWQTPGSHDEA